MAADCAIELKKHKVAFVSLWPGPVRTEKLTHLMEQKGFGDSDDVVRFLFIFHLAHGYCIFSCMCNNSTCMSVCFVVFSSYVILLSMNLTVAANLPLFVCALSVSETAGADLYEWRNTRICRTGSG